MALKKAQRKSKKFKGSIQGASGSGKTFTALRIMTKLVSLTDPGKRIAVIDSENAAELYAPPFDFDVDDDWTVKNAKGEVTGLNYSPLRAEEKLEAIRKETNPDGSPKYAGVIFDTASHIYKDMPGCLLSQIDQICDGERARGKSPNSFAAWKQVDPVYRRFMAYIRNYPLHIILCVRAKQAYEKDTSPNGRGQMKKIGLEPEFRDGFEFEMDAQFSIDDEHTMVPRKHRLQSYLDGKVFKEPGDDVAKIIYDWSTDGTVPEEVVVPPLAVVAVTEPTPDVPPPTGTNLKDAFIAEIQVAPSQEALTDIRGRANEVKSKLADVEWKQISAAYAARLRELNQAQDTSAAAQ